MKIKIGGIIFLDENADATMNDNEKGLGGINVYLYRLAKEGETPEVILSGIPLAVVSKAVTDENGTYAFIVAEEGVYYVWADSSNAYEYNGVTLPPAEGMAAVNTLDLNGLSQAVLFVYESGKTSYESLNVDGGLIGATGSLKITKTEKGTILSETPIFLPGARFRAINAWGNIAADHIVTDMNGEADVPGLPVGGYILEETEAPEGYARGEDKIEFSITKNSTQSISIENDKESVVVVPDGGENNGSTPDGGENDGTAPGGEVNNGTASNGGSNVTGNISIVDSGTPNGADIDITPQLTPGGSVTITQNDEIYTLTPDTDTGLYTVTDTEGTPLGYISIPEAVIDGEMSVEETLKEMNIIEELIALGSVKLNPKTGDRKIYGVLLFAATVLLLAALAKIVFLKRKYSNRR